MKTINKSYKYVIAGTSHAGLSALHTIREKDIRSVILIITKEDHLPYSPTILPYVVSDKIEPDKIFLRDETFFKRRNVHFLMNEAVKSVDSEESVFTLTSNRQIQFENLLLATGSTPLLPPIAGLGKSPFFTLRTLDDAARLNQAAKNARSAIVLGGGLIGMHVGESLHKKGLKVTIVEAKQEVLSEYFDPTASHLIRDLFVENGITLLTGSAVTHVAASGGASAVSLYSGVDLSADLLIIATGVQPNHGYLDDHQGGIRVDQGILVDDTMRTSAGNIWAAGDVARREKGKGAHLATLPNAVLQGKIAGRGMAGKEKVRGVTSYTPMNVFNFFGNRCATVGSIDGPDTQADVTTDHILLSSTLKYQKLLYQDNRLMGVISINGMIDPGIISFLIKERVDIAKDRKSLSKDPKNTGRAIYARCYQ